MATIRHCDSNDSPNPEYPCIRHAQIDAAVATARWDERRKTLEALAALNCFGCAQRVGYPIVGLAGVLRHPLWHAGHPCHVANFYRWLTEQEEKEK